VNAYQLSPLIVSHSCSTSSLSSCCTFTLRLGGMRHLRSSLVLFFLSRALSCQTRLIRVSGMRRYQGRKGGRQQCMYLERTRMIDVSISCLVVVLDGFPQRLERQSKILIYYQESRVDCPPSIVSPSVVARLIKWLNPCFLLSSPLAFIPPVSLITIDQQLADDGSSSYLSFARTVIFVVRSVSSFPNNRTLQRCPGMLAFIP